MSAMYVAFTLNGTPVEVRARPLDSLTHALREMLDVTSVKVGCNQGACGTCTVLLDGEPVRSCLTPVALVQGRSVTTLEGLGDMAHLHPLQTAFHQNYAAQCGFCTPGQILTARALLDKNPGPTREEITAAMSGNLCRCTGYVKIVDAIAQAAAEMAKR